MTKLTFILASMLLAGCAANSYCEGDQDYENAASVPVIQSAEGLQVKESTAALKIPPEPETKVPYGQRTVDADGDEVVSCLDRPPALVLPEPKEEPAAPVQPATPAAPATPAEKPAEPG
jgi:hypothetical protein